MRTVCRVRVSSALTYWSLLAHGRSLVCSSRAKFWTLPRRRSDQASQRTKLTRSYTTRPSSATPIRPRWDIGTIPNPCARTSAPAPMPSVSCRQPFNFFLHAALRSVNEAICHGIPDKRKLREGDIINIGAFMCLARKTCTAYIYPDDSATRCIGVLRRYDRSSFAC